MRASVVARGDATPVLEPSEHVLGAMTLPAERAVVWDRHCRLRVDGMQGVMPCALRGGVVGGAVVSAIGDQLAPTV